MPIIAIAPLIIIFVTNTQAADDVRHRCYLPDHCQHPLGLHSVDPGLVNLLRMNRAGRLQTLVRLWIASALPHFSTARRFRRASP